MDDTAPARGSEQLASGSGAIGGQSRRRVVRLTGGDPVVSGRGAEVTLELAERGVVTALVPGGVW